MLVIDSNQTIKMTKGDDVKIPLFLDKGTSLSPMRYEIEGNLGCEAYFYIYKLRNYDTPVLFKTYRDDGTIITEKNGAITEKTGVININDDKDFIIRLYPEDTNDLDEGQYIYQIKVKIIDSENSGDDTQNSFIINTVTNRLPIYIIEDDYDRRIW